MSIKERGDRIISIQCAIFVGSTSESSRWIREMRVGKSRKIDAIHHAREGGKKRFTEGLL